MNLESQDQGVRIRKSAADSESGTARSWSLAEGRGLWSLSSNNSPIGPGPLFLFCFRLWATAISFVPWNQAF